MFYLSFEYLNLQIGMLTRKSDTGIQGTVKLRGRAEQVEFNRDSSPFVGFQFEFQTLTRDIGAL